jgi:hypothetical protein
MNTSTSILLTDMYILRTVVLVDRSCEMYDHTCLSVQWEVHLHQLIWSCMMVGQYASVHVRTSGKSTVGCVGRRGFHPSFFPIVSADRDS